MPQVCDFSDQSFDLGQCAPHFVGIISYVSDDAGKNLTSHRFQRALSLNLTVTLVCEQGDQPALRGSAGGSHDAAIANSQADALGYDPQAAIYYVAEDPSTLPSSSYGTVDQYFDAVKAHGGRPIGAYGGHNLVSHLMSTGRATYGWGVQTWGGASGLHLEQLVGANTYGLPIDADQVLQNDYGQHPRPGPSTSQGEEANMIATDPDSGGFWATDVSGDVANYNGAPFIPGLNTHPNWHAGQIESGQQNKVVGFAAFKDRHGDWGVVFQTAPESGAVDQSQYAYYRLARDGSPD